MCIRDRFVPYHFLQSVITKITGAVIVAGSAYFYINGTMSAVYAIGMTTSAFMLYSSLECAGNYSSLLHVVSVCVDLSLIHIFWEFGSIEEHFKYRNAVMQTYIYGNFPVFEGLDVYKRQSSDKVLSSAMVSVRSCFSSSILGI